MRKNKTSALSWVMWGLIAFFYFYQYIGRSSAPSILTEELMRFFSLDAAGIGTLVGYYYFFYTMMQIPVGMLLDRFGPRNLASIACFLCGLGMALFIATPNYWIAALGRILTGIGSAFAFVSSLKMASNWFPKSRVGFMAGLTVTIGVAGPFLMGPILAALVKVFEWRSVLLILAYVGMAIAVFIWITARDKPHDHDHHEEEMHENHIHQGECVKEALKTILTNKQCWLLALYAMLMYSPISAFADMWGTTFLRKAYEIDGVVASSINNMIYVGMAFGSPITAWFSTYTQSRKTPMYISTVFALIFFSIASLVSSVPLWMMYILLFLSGFFTCGQIVAFAAGLDVLPRKFSGSISGFINMICMVSGVVLQPLLGKILTIVWNGQIENGVPVYLPQDYRYGFAMIDIWLLIAFIVIVLIKETYPKKLRKTHHKLVL